MNCPNCGATVQPGINRCEKCGSFVEQAPTPPPASAVQYVPVAQIPVPVAPGPPKSRIVAGLLGIFLGGLGIHRFYMGCAGIGVAQLLLTVVGSWFTCGVTGIVAWMWGLTEGILILAGAISTDGEGQPLE